MIIKTRNAEEWRVLLAKTGPPVTQLNVESLKGLTDILGTSELNSVTF